MDNNIRLIAALVILRNVVFAGDNLALLSGTLRTYHKIACDFDKITLNCPRGTSITIEIAQYKKPSPDSKEYTTCPLQRLNQSNNQEFKEESTENCHWPDTLKYSLLQTAIETCQKKTMCKFIAAPKSLAANPCPDVRRFIFFAYKCRPYEFRSKIACENEVIQLTCNPHDRITILSASYGRTEYESVQCAQPQGVLEETCLVSYANERVMQMCHGRRRCIISADIATFGNPCKPESRMYLKIVYTCVPKQILKDVYDYASEPDEPAVFLSTEANEIYHDEQFFKESEAIPPAPKVHEGLANVATGNVSTANGNNDGTKDRSRNFDDIMFEDNTDLFNIYIVLTATVFVLMTLIILVIGRIVLMKKNSTPDAKVHECNVGLEMPSQGLDDSKGEDVASLGDDLHSSTNISILNISQDDQLFGSTYTPSAYANLDPDNISYTIVPANSRLAGPTGSVAGFSSSLFNPSTFHPEYYPVKLNRQCVVTTVSSHLPYLYNEQSINSKQKTTNFDGFYQG